MSSVALTLFYFFFQAAHQGQEFLERRNADMKVYMVVRVIKIIRIVVHLVYQDC